MSSVKELALKCLEEYRAAQQAKLAAAEEHCRTRGFIRPEDYDIRVPLTTRCSVCGEYQHNTVSGVSCKNGHGGVDGVEQEDQLEGAITGYPGESIVGHPGNPCSEQQQGLVDRIFNHHADLPSPDRRWSGGASKNPARKQSEGLLPYSDTLPLRVHACCAWLVQYEGAEHILLTATSLSVEDVHHVVSTHANGHPFRLRALDAGEFSIIKTLHSMSGDARYIDQDLKVGI